MLGKSASALFIACALASLGLVLPHDTDGPHPVRRAHAGDTSDTAVIEGTILLPPRQNDRRRFRGRAYRQRTNRGTPSAATTQRSDPENRYRTVIVSAHPLSNDPGVEPLAEPATIDQEDASFVPQVTAVTVGTTVEFVNSDPFYHNVFSLTPGARFNIGRRPTGVVVPETMPAIDKPAPGIGIIELHCDIHPQMNAFIVSLETPHFSRAHADGTYRLENLPPGRYRIHAFMPRQDLVSFTVDLRDGQRASRRIDLR